MVMAAIAATWHLLAPLKHNAPFIVCAGLLIIGMVLRLFSFKRFWLCCFREYFPMPTLLLIAFYCLRGIDFSHNPYGIPECLTVIVTTVLYLKKRNTILSFFSGLVVYMILATVYLSQ